MEFISKVRNVQAVSMERYRFSVILEESHSFRVLGKSGRGLAEHYGVHASVLPQLWFPCDIEMVI